MRQDGLQLSPAEIHAAFAAPVASQLFPPILSPEQAALLLGRTPMAIYHLCGREELKGAIRKRGKHILIWRNRVIAVSMGQHFRCGPTGSIQLTRQEITAAFADPEVLAKFPPILGPDRMAELLGISRATLYLWLQLGHFATATYQRRRNIVLWRDGAIEVVFNHPKWRKPLVTSNITL